MSDCCYLVQNDDGKWEKADFYDMDNPIEALTKAYQQGRADAIDELKPFVHFNYKGKKFLFVCAEDFNNLSFAEQLKEQNN